MLGVGDNFPAFSVKATTNLPLKDISIDNVFVDISNETYKGKWLVVFFYKNEGVAQRATYIVDPEGIIRFSMVTDLNVGRNVKEVLRVLDALQTDELCPCNWKKGEETIDLKKAA